ncbi:MAG: hypothetical protein GWN01_06855, partial [Nitrosopumilaceae archaeon]|nr:hypothetical protein [Nitrosopumilaceae archaeon]NIX61255.1 hypothetical protein [Nitrosopumilaceae archaeon]
LTGEQAVLRVFQKSRDEEGSLDVFALSSEVALALAYALQSLLYKDEDTLANYSLAQVFDLLERESINGFVDLQFSGKRGIGTVYFLEGSPVEAVIMSNKGKVASGEQVFHKFHEISELIQPQVNVHCVFEPGIIIEDEAFIIPWQHQKYILFWHQLLLYMRRLMNDYLKKNKFFENFGKACTEVSDHYPFLNPQEGEVYLTNQYLRIKNVLQLSTFQQGISLVLNKLLQQVPPRRFRKLDFEKVINDFLKIAEENDIPLAQPDFEKLAAKIFRGYIQ